MATEGPEKVYEQRFRTNRNQDCTQSLNQKAIEEAYYEVTAISFHAYPYVQKKYALMPSGGSVGEGYGPMIVASRPCTPEDVKKMTIAIPGKLTTAVLALKLFAPDLQTEFVPFDKIIGAVLEGKYEAGLIIHEGQLTYDRSGLHRIVDLGRWWRELTGLPLPLGANAIRKDLGPETIAKVCKALRDSIQHALDNREQALQYAMQFARDLDEKDADKFVGMYVNERTLDYGEDGREAVAKLLNMGHDQGIIRPSIKLDWVSQPV